MRKNRMRKRGEDTRKSTEEIKLNREQEDTRTRSNEKEKKREGEDIQAKRDAYRIGDKIATKKKESKK